MADKTGLGIDLGAAAEQDTQSLVDGIMGGLKDFGASIGESVSRAFETPNQYNAMGELRPATTADKVSHILGLPGAVIQGVTSLPGKLLGDFGGTLADVGEAIDPRFRAASTLLDLGGQRDENAMSKAMGIEDAKLDLQLKQDQVTANEVARITGFMQLPEEQRQALLEATAQKKAERAKEAAAKAAMPTTQQQVEGIIQTVQNQKIFDPTKLGLSDEVVAAAADSSAGIQDILTQAGMDRESAALMSKNMTHTQAVDWALDKMKADAGFSQSLTMEAIKQRAKLSEPTDVEKDYMAWERAVDSGDQGLIEATRAKVIKNAQRQETPGVFFDKDGNVSYATGSQVALQKSTAYQSKLLEQQQAARELLDVANRLDNLTGPDTVGVGALTNKTVNWLVGNSGWYTQQDINDFKGALDPNTEESVHARNMLQKLYTPELPAAEANRILLAAKVARMNNPDGRISDHDFNFAEKVVGAVGLWTNPIDAKLKISEIIRMGERQQLDNQNRLDEIGNTIRMLNQPSPLERQLDKAEGRTEMTKTDKQNPYRGMSAKAIVETLSNEELVKAYKEGLLSSSQKLQVQKLLQEGQSKEKK